MRISGFRIRKNRKTRKLHMTYHIKALGKLVNVVKLEIRISGFWLGKNRKNRKNLEKNHVTYQIKALGKLVNVVMLKTQIFVLGFQKSLKKIRKFGKKSGD